MDRAVVWQGERKPVAQRTSRRAQHRLIILICVNVSYSFRRVAENTTRPAGAPQNALQKLSGMRVPGLRNLFGRSGRDDFPTRITSFRAEIDDPISALNHLQIVLDDHERMPAIHKALE